MAEGWDRQWLTFLDLHRSPRKRPQTNKTSGLVQTTTENHTISSPNGTPKGSSQQAPEPTAVNPAMRGQTPLWSWPVLTASQPKGKPHLLMCQEQSSLNYERKAHNSHTRGIPGERKTAPLGHTRHLLYKVTLLGLGDIDPT